MRQSPAPRKGSDDHYSAVAAELPDLTRDGRSLPGDLALTIFRHLVRTRLVEERAIKMSKSGESYFWVGGPGEEVLNVCLGLQVNKGHGPAHDYLHLHYRNAGLMLAMGMPMVEHFRQHAMRVTDSHSMGRNFVGHYAKAEWNVIPVSSVIEVQFAMAPGTALMQQRHGGDGISIVIGGDAGTAEGDFATCMIWSTRPGYEVPVLMVVTNNGYGISTTAESQHSEKRIADRGRPFGIRGEQINGNDLLACWHGIARAVQYCRQERRPFLVEALVSRLHGHSSSSGAKRIDTEPDCVALAEQELLDAGILDAEQAEQIWQEAREEVDLAVEEALADPEPAPADVARHTYAPSEVDVVYPGDYTGLPRGGQTMRP